MDWRESAAQLERARAEEAVTIPAEHGRLFAIYTPPAPGAPPAGRCVVLFTRPRGHRNRMMVELARELAVRGFSALRFDYHGCGDSEGTRSFLNPNRPYLDDTIAVMRWLRKERHEQRFVLVGSCFDARTALSGFMESPSAIDGIVFMAAPVMELHTMVAAHADEKDFGHLFRALRNPDNWKSLGSAERWRHMAIVLSRVTRRALGGRAASEERNDTPLADSFVMHFRALVRSDARALFLYGESDQETATFKVALDTVFARIPPSTAARFDVEVWPGEVHGFLTLDVQRRVLACTLEWIRTFHPQSRAAASNGHGAEAPWTSR